MIKYCKGRLAVAERKLGDGRWVFAVDGLVKEYNSRIIPGTGDVRRSDVSKMNYLELLEKLYKSGEPTALMNMSVSGQSSLAPFVWKYDVGDKVLLARKVSSEISASKRFFEKEAVRGAYGPKVYEIEARKTKLNSKLFLCATYALVGLPGQLFYQTDLIEASYLRRGRR